MNKINFAVGIGGENGQGIASTGNILALIFARRGLHLNAYNAYQSIIRGGHTFLTIRASDAPVRNMGDKIDVFIQKSTAQAQHEQQRAIQVAIAPGARPLWISSAEDMILEKLLWWQLGGGISTRQWADIIGIIQA